MNGHEMTREEEIAFLVARGMTREQAVEYLAQVEVNADPATPERIDEILREELGLPPRGSDPSD